MQRARPSRRSACDRCRDYKLRCDRSSPGAESCERCVKNNVICATTLALASAGSDQPDQQHSRWDTGLGLGSLDPSSLQRPVDGAVDAALDANSTSNGTTPWSPRGSNAFSPLANLHNAYTATVGTAGTDMNSIDSGIDFDMAMVDFTFPAHPPAGSGRSNKQQERVSPTSVGPSVFDELVNFQDPYVIPFSEPDRRGTTPHSPDAGSRAITTSLKDLSALIIKLLEDDEDMSKTYANPESLLSLPAMETAIRSTLSRTSRLSEIVKELAASTTPSSGTASLGMNLAVAHIGNNMPPSLKQGTAEEGFANSRQAGGHLSLDAGRQNHDVLLMSTLVTTYILLTHNWRRTLVHLNHLIMTMPAGNVALLAPVLPTLQLGEFHFRASTCVQIGALLDVITANLEMFEVYLGISSGDGPDRSNGSAGRVKRLAISSDPVSIAIRETLLSQERMKKVSKNGSSELSLKELIHQISGYLFIHMKACKP